MQIDFHLRAVIGNRGKAAERSLVTGVSGCEVNVDPGPRDEVLGPPAEGHQQRRTEGRVWSWNNMAAENQLITGKSIMHVRIRVFASPSADCDPNVTGGVHRRRSTWFLSGGAFLPSFLPDHLPD